MHDCIAVTIDQIQPCVRPVIRGIDATSHAKSADGEAARKMCIGLAA
ncbi:hypothetical protein SAMN05216228_10914 [Rhizobium tibeticum]|uniref:Uncharacterized protein n=1 Tax=Rhizobium tibeticum TaxID=501024 RepID=A0ABY1AYP1_9HYPH|nr:hypothetical protein SAMN05216228_10914 [Rhizobium tibeticum]